MGKQGEPSNKLCWPRRNVVGWLTAGLTVPQIAYSSENRPISFGLTPVFLDSDIRLLADLKEYLSETLRQPVTLVKRRTYQEITLMLLSGQLDAAWICGFPFIQYRSELSVMVVPVYQGQPLYQSYLIVDKDSGQHSLEQLQGQVHAFSDPDSNSGFLVTQALLSQNGYRPDTFFTQHFFTYGHRNVIRAVASGLAHSGSVDGYVWDVMAKTEPELTNQTRVIRKSEWLGFPPIACRKGAHSSQVTQHITTALAAMSDDALGKRILETLHLDGFQVEDPSLFDSIARLYKTVQDEA